MKKTKWLDRALIVGPHLALATSEKECQMAFRHCAVPKDEWPAWVNNGHSDATTHFIESHDGGLTCVVALRAREGINGVQVAALLVHEAVHIWQEFRLRIGEKSPSAEFEAYSIQTIAQRLMEAYQDTLK